MSGRPSYSFAYGRELRKPPLRHNRSNYSPFSPGRIYDYVPTEAIKETMLDRTSCNVVPTQNK